MTNKTQLLKVWLSIFLLLFGLKFGSFIDLIWIFCLFIIFHHLIIMKEKINVDFPFLAILFYTCYILFIMLINNVYDQWHIFQPIRCLINYLGISILIDRYYKNKVEFELLLSMINYVVYMHALIVIVTFLSPELRMIIQNATGFVEKSYLRSAGLTHSYGITSLIHLIPFITVPLIRKKILPFYFDVLGLVMTFFSLFFLARVGLYTLPFIFFSLIIYSFYNREINYSYLLTILGLMISVVAIIQLFLSDFVTSLIDSSSILADSPMIIYFHEIVSFALEIVVSTLEGDTSINSVDTIGNFTFFNHSVLQYIFGTGYYGRGDIFNYLPTDVSYAHFFSMVGIFGIFIILSVYVVPIFLYQGAKRDVKFVYFFLLLIIIITNYKEATFFTRTLFSLWAIFVVILRNESFKNQPTKA